MPQDADLLCGKRFAIRRHSLVSVAGGDEVNQSALGTVADLQELGEKRVRSAIEPQPGFLLLVAVAGVTVPGEDRFDVADEFDRTIGRGGKISATTGDAR